MRCFYLIIGLYTQTIETDEFRNNLSRETDNINNIEIR